MQAKFILKIIGLLNAIGGLMMAIDLIFIISSTKQNNLPVALILFLIIGIHIVSGVLLFINKVSGYYISVISFVIQSVYLKIFGLSFYTFIGIRLLIYIKTGFAFGTFVKIGNGYTLLYNPSDTELIIGFNIIPIIFLIILNIYKSSKKPNTI